MSLIPGLMLTGVVFVICGAMASFSWRKEGVSAGELWLAGSKAAAYPERYVRPDRVRAVRVMNCIGVGLWLAGVVVIIAKTLRHP